MSTLSIRLRYRPLRIGWCVMSNDFEGFRHAARSSFTMWGGSYNPIIPIDDRGLADSLVRLFRVDALFSATQSPEVKSYIKAFDYIPQPLFSEELFRFDGHTGRASVLDIRHPIQNLRAELLRNTTFAPDIVDAFEWDENDPLKDVFLSTYGQVPPYEQTHIDYDNLFINQLFAKKIKIGNGAELPPIRPFRMSLFDVNRVDMRRHYVVNNFGYRSGFYFGDATNFNDLVEYWNLRAADIDVQFYDYNNNDRYTHIKNSWKSALEAAKQEDIHNSKYTIYHPNVSGERNEKIEGAINSFEPVPNTTNHVAVNSLHKSLWNGLNLRAPVMYFGEVSTLASVDDRTSRQSISFPLPERKFDNVESLLDQIYVVSLDAGEARFDTDRLTLNAPFIPELNQYYGKNVFHSWNSARAEPDSIGLIVSTYASDLSVTALDVNQLIFGIFKANGIICEASRAGLVGTSLIRQMGGLPGCRPFKIAGVRTLISRHRPDQSFSRSDAMLTILGQHKDRPLSDYNWLYIEPRSSGTKLSNSAVLGYLLDRGVFRPGLNFECPNCQLEFWRSLDDANVQLICDYCGHPFNGSRQLKDKDWAFRRSGLFGRNDHQEGAIPVALTIMQLMSVLGMRGSIYSTALSLRKDWAEIPDCETDFVIVTRRLNGRKIQIVIGECKTNMPITESDVANLSAVSDSFPIEMYDVFVVFSRLNEFTEDEIQLIKTLNAGHRDRAIMLTARELEPMFIYERTGEEFDIDKTAVTLEQLAEATDRIFFQKLRKQ